MSGIPMEFEKIEDGCAFFAIPSLDMTIDIPVYNIDSGQDFMITGEGKYTYLAQTHDDSTLGKFLVIAEEGAQVLALTIDDETACIEGCYVFNRQSD